MAANRRKVLLVISIVISFILTLIILLVSVLAPASLGVKQGELDRSYGTVIADIDGIIEANPRFIDIALLGSHDSFSSLLEKTGRTEKNASSTMKSLMPLIGNYAYRFGITQTVGIYDQMMQGARFLQLKVTYYDGEWYTSHTVLSGTLETHLLEILHFLCQDTAKGEAVGILFQPIFMGDNSLSELREYIANVRYNGKSLFDFVHYSEVDEFNDGRGLSISSIRYNDVTSSGNSAGVVLFERRDEHYTETWDSDLTKYPYFYDLDKNAIHVWHQSSNASKLEKGIEDTYKMINATNEYDDVLRINQTQACIAVGSVADIYSDVTARSLMKIAKDHNNRLIARDDFFDMLRAMPVFQVDFLTSTYGDFNTKVNALIREYNEKLVSD